MRHWLIAVELEIVDQNDRLTPEQVKAAFIDLYSESKKIRVVQVSDPILKAS